MIWVPVTLDGRVRRSLLCWWTLCVLGCSTGQSARAPRSTATPHPSECQDGEGCHALALSAEHDRPSESDRLLARACELKHLESCYDLAVHQLGKGEVGEAVAHYQVACSGGHLPACYNLGTCLVNGECTSDPVRGNELLRRACEGGQPHGCVNLGASYFSGRGVEKKPAEAVRLFERACTEGVALGCHNLGVLFDQGEYVARDSKRARALFKQACEGGWEESCAP